LVLSLIIRGFMYLSCNSVNDLKSFRVTLNGVRSNNTENLDNNQKIILHDFRSCF